MADDGRPIIDEKGRIFGLVNVIDALVVVIVAAVVVAGVSFVVFSPDSDPEPESDSEPESDAGPATVTRYATLEFTDSRRAMLIAEGDSFQLNDNATVTVTDVYRANTDGNPRTFARVRLESVERDTEDGSQFVYGDGPPRIGRELTVETDRYRIGGVIRTAGETGETLELAETAVVLDAEVSAETVAKLSVGDRYEIDNRTVATVESLAAYGTGSPDTRRAQVGIRYVTIQPDTRPQFGGTVVREGARLPFETDQYGFEGEVHQVGSAELPGEPAVREVTLQLQNVDSERADYFEAGMVERINSETVAELTDVDVEPTMVVAGDGELVESPTQRRVTMTAELRVRETTAGPLFKTEPLRVGERIVLEFEDTTVEAEVIER